MAWWAALAGQGAAQMGKLDDAITGRVMSGWADKRQIRQQKKLQALAIEGQKEMNMFDQQLAYDMWEKTNFKAQREQMEKAGLNVGLMYNQGGPGGSTQGAGSGSSVAQGQAPVGGFEIQAAMQAGTQARLAAAQTQLINAQTKNVEADTEKKTGVDTELTSTQIDKIAAETQNERIKSGLLELDGKIKEVEKNIAETTEQTAIDTMAQAYIKMAGEAQSAMSQGQVDNATAQNKIEQAKIATTQAMVNVAATKQKIELDQKTIQKLGAEIAKMSEDVRAKWREWEQGEKERWLKERLVKAGEAETEFGTGALAQTKQLVDIVTSILKATPTPSGGGKSIGFKQ